MLIAGDTSTLTLDVASIDSARFMGTGQIILDRNNMELTNVVNDGLLETTKTIKLATGIVQNNNKFTVKAGGRWSQWGCHWPAWNRGASICGGKWSGHQRARRSVTRERGRSHDLRDRSGQ